MALPVDACDHRLGILFSAELFSVLKREILGHCTDRSLATLAQVNKAWEQHLSSFLRACLWRGIVLQTDCSWLGVRNGLDPQKWPRRDLVWSGRFVTLGVQLIDDVCVCIQVHWNGEAYRAPYPNPNRLAIYAKTCTLQSPALLSMSLSRPRTDKGPLIEEVAGVKPLKCRLLWDPAFKAFPFSELSLDTAFFPGSWITPRASTSSNANSYVVLNGVRVDNERHAHLLSISPRYQEVVAGTYPGDVIFHWSGLYIETDENPEADCTLFFVDDPKAVNYELKRMLAIGWRALFSNKT